jgi:hypothetical protein
MTETGPPSEERRPPIPLPIQRAVRQRCAFGCIICGHPLYEYHHMIPYAEVHEHTEGNITLLCDGHHREATNGLLTPEQIASANSAPYNVASGVSRPFALHFSGPELRVEIGTNSFSGGLPHPDGGTAFIPISVDDNDLVWFRVDAQGRIFLHLTILDECNLPLLRVVENHLIYRADTWDIEFKGKILTLRQAPRDIFLEIEFVPPNTLRLIRGRLLCNGVEMLILIDHILIVNAGQSFSHCAIKGGAIGLQLGRNERGYPCCMRSEPRGLKRYGIDRDMLIEYDKRNAEKMKAFGASNTPEEEGVGKEPITPE